MAVLADYGIEVEQRAAEIDEIQHHDPLKITEAKARVAYELIRRPLVVNDATWRIPALNGFPGGYMRYVGEWFAPEDFLNLMASKSDRTVFRDDVTAYFDGERYVAFTAQHRGEFVREAAVGFGPSINSVVAMDGDDGQTLSQVFTDRQGGRAVRVGNYADWQKFGKWYTENYKEETV